MSRRPPSAAELQRQVDHWNARYPVGQKVSLKKDSGEAMVTTTRSVAEVQSGHSAVIWLDGVSGCYLLNRVSAITAAAERSA